MTVEAATNKAGPYNVTGTSGTFARPFLIRDAAHLRVIRLRDGDEADLTSGITHTGINTADGSVSINAGLQAGDVIYLLRDVPNVQASDYNAQGRVRPDQIESDLDLAAMQIQDLREAQDRALTLPVSSELSGEEALEAAIRAPEFAVQARDAAERAELAASRVAPEFPSRAALIAALPNLTAMQHVRVGDVGYVVDPSATGMASAMWDIGVNGLRAQDRPENAYIAAFHDHNSPRVIRIYTSTDGVAWGLLNTLPLEYDAGVINGGNPVIKWHDGWFYMLVSFTSVGNWDFRIYKTRDFTSFVGPFNCNLGPTPISSNTNPAPGGSVPANEVWGADMVFTPEGEMHVWASIPFGPNVLDIRGRELGNRRNYRSVCTNLEALTFSPPTIVLPGGNNWTMIDPSLTRTPSSWLLNIKDSLKQTIRVYTGPSVTGPWTYQEEVDNPAYAIEGSSIVPRRLSSGAVAWDLYAEAHNTIPDWVATQQIMVYRGSTALSGWGLRTPTWLKSTKGIRHGTPLNLGFEDPAAYRAIQRATSFAAGGVTATNEQWNELMPGSRSIVPNPGAVYYVTGGDVTNLSILDSVANEFYLAVLSTNNVAGINVVDNGRVLGSISLGFGMSNNRLVRFVRREDTGRYHAEIGAGRPTFAANKDGASQTISAGAMTQVTFPNEVIDAGGFFSGNGWTPPAGRYLIQASISVTGTSADQTNTLELRRNGVSVRRITQRTLTGGANCLSVSAVLPANGSDTFTLHTEFPGSGDKTISGTPDVTWFEGAPV